MHTSLMSLPSSSLISAVRRSSSASMPTEERTSLMSLAEGEVLPARPRRRYAAKCFILRFSADSGQSMAYNGACMFGAGEEDVEARTVVVVGGTGESITFKHWNCSAD